jgi:hypothetical protein
MVDVESVEIDDPVLAKGRPEYSPLSTMIATTLRRADIDVRPSVDGTVFTILSIADFVTVIRWCARLTGSRFVPVTLGDDGELAVTLRTRTASVTLRAAGDGAVVLRRCAAHAFHRASDATTFFDAAASIDLQAILRELGSLDYSAA